MPPAEFAAEGGYCTGDDCHKIAPKWERSEAEVTPPGSSNCRGLVRGRIWRRPGLGGQNAPIHFGDTTPASPEVGENESKLAPKTPAKTVEKKVAGSNGKSKLFRRLPRE